MKKLVLLLGVLASMNAFAGEFDEDSPEYDTRPVPGYTEADIQRKIQEEMAVACSNNLCTIVGTDSAGSSWTVAFQVGYGRPTNTGSGDTIYIGDKYQNESEKGYASVTVAYKNYKCTTNMRVTPSVYRFVNTYMYNMVNADGSTKRNFSPADQTVILFYTTMLNKVEGCKNNNL